MFRKALPSIRFTCAPEDHGVIAPPVEAKTHMPDWFRKLPPLDKGARSATDSGLTVKRCMPFLDALTTGYILPLAATVRLEVRGGGRTVEAGWEFDKPLVSYHGAHQVAGHPSLPNPPCKFHNYWSIRTPKGWSCLFVPPLNRKDAIFEPVAGIVDTDTYTAPIHFPCFIHALDGLYTLEKGTPLVQVIPFRRSSTLLPMHVAAETAAEAEERRMVARNTLASEGWYRLFARAGR